MPTINRFSFLQCTVLFVMLISLMQAQTNAEKTDIQNVLVRILNNSESQNFQAVSSLIAYTGEDETRNMKDTFKFSNAKEKSKVKRLAKKIKAFQDLSDSYSVGNITKNSNPAGDLYLVEVSFNSGKQSLTTVFTFTVVKNSFKLVEVK